MFIAADGHTETQRGVVVSTNWYGRRILITANVDFVNISRYQSTVTPKRTGQNLFVYIGKSKAEAIYNKSKVSEVK